MTTPAIPVFSSALATHLTDYLAYKTALGFYGASRVHYLKHFDAYCADHDLTTFNRATVEGWVTAGLSRGSAHRSWISYIRDVGRYLRTHGMPDAYVLSEKFRAPVHRTQPYLFSTATIDAFFAAAGQLHTTSPWQWQATAFFLLMHSCGLRTGETRTLRVDQVHLADRFLDITDSKGRRSRRLPITDDITTILTNCDATTRAQFPDRERFFVSSTGNPVTAAAVGVTFHRIWDLAGLARPTDGGTQPRPYDFRHHFAYGNLHRWMLQDVDVTAMLPYLSRYMGHATFESTYYYIHTSPDFLGSYADLTATTATVLPEVGFE